MRRHVLLIVALACVLTGPAMAADKEVINLFNGQDLSGWTCYLDAPGAKLEDVWSVENGLIICQGKPMGYLATKQTFKNFKLVVEWRWAPGKDPGNSGVLMRITGKPMMLPRCVEAQLKSGSAGDIYGFQGFTVKGDADRFSERDIPNLGHLMGVTQIKGNEHEPGQWNEYEITLQDGNLKLEVNGQVVNEATNCDVVAGQIGLQSEGGEIHFRTVKLKPLD